MVICLHDVQQIILSTCIIIIQLWLQLSVALAKYSHYIPKPLPITIDEMDVSPSVSVTSNITPMPTVEDTNDILTPSGGTNTLSAAMITGAASVIPEVSPLTSSATTMSLNELTTTTESLGIEDVNHFTTYRRQNRNKSSTREGE